MLKVAFEEKHSKPLSTLNSVTNEYQ